MSTDSGGIGNKPDVVPGLKGRYVILCQVQ